MNQEPVASTLAEDAERMRLALELLQFNPRLPLLISETGLSRERLTRLYRQEKGCSPPKGQLPSSLEWFMPWLRNIHGAIYLNYFNFLRYQAGVPRVRALMDAYRMYLEHTNQDTEPVIAFNRAWTLVRYLDGNILKLTSCRKCYCRLLTRIHQRESTFICPMCAPPNRSTAEAAMACFASVPSINEAAPHEEEVSSAQEAPVLLEPEAMPEVANIRLMYSPEKVPDVDGRRQLALAQSCSE